MSDRLHATAAWNRARALKLHEHFRAVALAVQAGGKVGRELERAVSLLDGLLVRFPDGHDGFGEMLLEMSWTTINREWGYWQRGGRQGKEQAAQIHRPEALLCTYQAGCGGHAKMPRLLIQELHRRMTLTTGGRDKHGKSPITVALASIQRDFAARRPLPGIDYAQFPIGAEFPWHASTVYRHKPSRGLRALGNRGASAHKAASAYISLDYSQLRKGELYTLDDVRLDIVCIDEATGEAIEVVLYVFMEVGSRSIVGYVMKPAKAITQEDVDELLAHMLQTPGFGVGVGYTTHLLFERGTVACSEAAQAVIEGVTEGNVKVHRTGMVGGVRWVGAARDKARGNAAGKAVIESFNRWLHYALLDLPGQRGNLYANQPENLGDVGKGRFFAQLQSGLTKQGGGLSRTSNGTLIDQAEQLAQFQIVAGHRVKLRLPALYLLQLNAAVAAAIRRHNTEPGHDYRGHGKHFQAEVAPGVWRDAIGANTSGEEDDFAGVAELADAPDSGTATAGVDRPETATALQVQILPPAPAGCETAAPAPGKKTYTLNLAPAPLTRQQLTGRYWQTWKAIEKAQPGLSRHALTHRALGRIVPLKAMTDEQLAKVVAVFAAVARDHQPS